MEDRFEYLIEVTYYDTHNTEVVTITTSDIKWSMKEYQRNRKPLNMKSLIGREKEIQECSKMKGIQNDKMYSRRINRTDDWMGFV